MSDIFISYSSADRDQIRMLAAFLESKGYTVWWDHNLVGGETFRRRILEELTKARAAIAVWTENSIHSEWVLAEASQSRKDGKLIALRASSLQAEQIPLPFGEVHTERLEDGPKILAAVVAQLAKPAVQPSALWRASKVLRYEVLTWVGIVGGAITLFANLQGVLNLADWAHWIVTH
jgi:TIR domain